MARFLFCSLSSPGFLFPAVGIGVALRKRGHTVAVLTDPAHSALLEHQGLELIHCDGQSGTCFRVELWGKLASVALQVKLLEKAMKTFPPDVIVGQQLTLAPLIVRERLKVPVGIIGFFTSLWPKWPPLVDDAPAQCIAHKNWLFEEMLKLYNASRSLFQLPHYPLSARELPFTGDLFMLRTIRELEGDISHLPEQVHLVGSCLWDNEQENDELEAWLREEAWSDRPVLYIQHGRLFDKPHFWPALLQGTENLRLRFVASVGRMDCELGQPPSNFFVRSHISQRQVLQKAGAMVASATSTAILGALTESVPSLLIPGGGEQPIAAERCRARGVAQVMEPACLSPETLAAEIKTLLADADLADAARQAAEAFGNVNSLNLAASLLENLAYTGSPVTRETVRSDQYFRPQVASD